MKIAKKVETKNEKQMLHSHIPVDQFVCHLTAFVIYHGWVALLLIHEPFVPVRYVLKGRCRNLVEAEQPAT